MTTILKKVMILDEANMMQLFMLPNEQLVSLNVKEYFQILYNENLLTLQPCFTLLTFTTLTMTPPTRTMNPFASTPLATTIAI